VPLGMTPQVLLKPLRAVTKEGQIVGMDVVELSPRFNSARKPSSWLAPSPLKKRKAPKKALTF
jgi:arginase family enzyme